MTHISPLHGRSGSPPRALLVSAVRMGQFVCLSAPVFCNLTEMEILVSLSPTGLASASPHLIHCFPVCHHVTPMSSCHLLFPLLVPHSPRLDPSAALPALVVLVYCWHLLWGMDILGSRHGLSPLSPWYPASPAPANKVTPFSACWFTGRRSWWKAHLPAQWNHPCVPWRKHLKLRPAELQATCTGSTSPVRGLSRVTLTCLKTLQDQAGHTHHLGPFHFLLCPRHPSRSQETCGLLSSPGI